MNEFPLRSDVEQRNILPRIHRAKTNYFGLPLFAAVVLIGGYTVFSSLESSRAASLAPQSFAPGNSSRVQIASPQPLSLPDPVTVTTPIERPALQNRAVLGLEREIVAPFSRRAPRTVPPALILPQTRQSRPEPAPPTPQRVVFEGQRNLPAAGSRTGIDNAGDRVTAERFLNPSLTIPQGTVIPAVLETALDSTRPGGARALIQRDIYSFDGTRVLIQRGSRLYGEYEADLRSGQNRARIQWTRILRPDGVTIALDSPASDPLGRAGVRGEVDTKFLQRFGGALLQSVLDIGVNVATREASGGVFVSLPGSTQNVQVQDPNQVLPTLKVRHGTSVSVFVARDLDFSTVE